LLYLIKQAERRHPRHPDCAKSPSSTSTYVEPHEGVRFELAAEYLLMAAMLGEIKSRMLLPRPKTDEGEEGDPRAELVRRLQEYERFKKAAEDIEIMPRMERDIFRGARLSPGFCARKATAGR
jgi:segregation and condensation protein A